MSIGIRSVRRRLPIPVFLALTPFLASSVRCQVSPLDPEQRFVQMQAAYETRIAQLEGRMAGLETALEAERRDSNEQNVSREIERIERQGLSSLGQTTLFSNTFNPAISLLGDFVFSWSDRKDSYQELNQFGLRAVELGIMGRVDPYLAYFAFIHFDPEEVELEEGYGILDNALPHHFSLKFGRYNVDFGKLSPIHDPELPFVDKPGIFQEYLGGSLRGTGIELHHWFALSESSLLRWSAGVINRPDGDGHPVVGVGGGSHEHGEEEEELDGIGKRGVDDFALTGRVTAAFDFSDAWSLQVGGSIVWAPHVRDFELEDSAADGPLPKETDPLVRFDRSQRTIGFDATLSWSDSVSGQAFRLSGEVLFNREEFEAEEEEKKKPEDFTSGPTFREHAFGFHTYAVYDFSREWSLGASFEWFERAEEDDADWWDAGVFVTWNVNEFHRFRAEVRYYDDEFGDDDFTAFLFQWTTILGSHGHGLPW